MASTGPIPWYDVPAREYPIKRWLRQRYPFVVSPAVFARRRAGPPAAWRPFPALVWLAQRERLGG